MNYVKHLNLFGVDAKEISCITGEGAPTTTTKGAVGLLYMDSLTGNVYKCTDDSNETYTWASLGGGASSWNDLTDKPFYEESNLIEIFPENTCTLEPLDEGYSTRQFPEGTSLNLEVGKTYVVTYNGTDYECLGTDMSAMEPGAVVLGNVGPMGLTDTGEPFLIMPGGYQEGVPVWALVSFENATSVTLKIAESTVVIHKLDEKFVGLFETKTVNTGEFTWDGDITGKVFADLSNDYTHYKIADITFEESAIVDGSSASVTVTVVSEAGDAVSQMVPTTIAKAMDGLYAIQKTDENGSTTMFAILVFTPGNGFEEAGIYAMRMVSAGTMYVSKLTLPGFPTETRKDLSADFWDAFWRTFESEMTIGGKY